MRSLFSSKNRARKFFAPHVGLPANLRGEIFYLAYHLHWPYHEILEMESNERRAYLNLLAEEITRQNREIEEAMKKR